MPRWPIRVKLIAGLSLVVGMMIILMAGSMFGLHSFHSSNLTLVDLLPELGASKQLMQVVAELDGSVQMSRSERQDLERKVLTAREALVVYFEKLKKNATRGNRVDYGRDELGLAFLIDDELTSILTDLNPLRKITPVFPGTRLYMKQRRQNGVKDELDNGKTDMPARLDRLKRRAMMLPDILHRDFYAVLVQSKLQYHSSRIIVWTSAVMVLAMLGGLSALFHRWVLYPVRLLHRGVRRVARGAFDGKITLRTGDEMQNLAEAFNDMTERLRVMYEDLERQVQERSSQLVRSERLAGVGFLAAGVAHEINNPLASIAFCSEALERRIEPFLDGSDQGDAKVVRDYLRMVQEEAFRCKRITEKLLDFSRCGEIRREPTDLTELVNDVIEMVRHMGKYRGKSIVFDPRESVYAYADAQEIKQVALNLVVNALDGMDPGGTLRIEAKHSGGMAELSFEDDGCGMSPEVLENIFEPFYTRRRDGKGTGLGLSISHRIISQHQGEIRAESPGEGLGATFTVRLPLRRADSGLRRQADRSEDVQEGLGKDAA